MEKRGRRGRKTSVGDEFFKVYLPDRSSQWMCVPPAFVKSFNGTVPSKAKLKDLSGKFWHVGMEEAENGVFFKDGWERFASDHSLEFGNFLVFRYDGNCSFDVKIFSNNGCMKEEAFGYNCINEGPSTVEKTIVPVKIEKESEEEHTCPKPTRDCKRKYAELDMKRSEKSKVTGSHEIRWHKSRRIASKTVESDGAFQGPEFSLPTNPRFIASFRQGEPFRVFLSKQFLSKNEIKMEPEMFLRDENGELWPVNVRISISNDGRVSFGKGWKKFWNFHDLGIGDKCEFEFVLRRGKRLCREIPVHILRAEDN